MATSQTQPQTQTQNKAPKEKPFVIVDFLDLDPANFTFLAPKVNNHGGHFIPVRYQGKTLYVTYEARSCPFGVSPSTEEKPEYKNKYSDGKKVTGYTTSISCHKEYENDPYYQKAAELDEFFINACHQNAMYWHIGGTSQRPLGRDAIEGFDDRGCDGRWKRFLKWSYKKDPTTGERKYLDYPPRLEFGIPTTSMSEHKGTDGIMVQEAVFKPVFFDQDANRQNAVTSDAVNDVLPKWCRLSVLAQWSTITQGTYGASLKPKAQQFRIYPNEQLQTDECLLNDDGEEEYELGDHLGGADFSAKVTKLNSNPAPLDGALEEEPETLEEDVVEVVGDDTDPDPEPDPEPEPVPEPVRSTRTITTRPTRRTIVSKKP